MKFNDFSIRTFLIILGLILLGSLLIFLSFNLIDKVGHFWINFFRVAGQTILSSTVFLGVIKSLQYTSYFQKALENVMYSDKFLEKQSSKDLKKKWLNITNALYSTFFPSLRDNLSNHILTRLITNNKNYYHKDMNIVYTITTIDEQNFKLEEYKNFRIIGDGINQLDFKLNAAVEKTKINTDLSDLQVIKLELDGEDYTGKVAEPKRIDLNDNAQKITVDFDYKLNTKDECKVITHLETIHTTSMHAYWRCTFDTFVESLSIDLHYDVSRFDIDVLCFGQTIKLKAENFKTFVRSRCENLIFPKDCVLLLIKFKNT